MRLVTLLGLAVSGALTAFSAVLSAQTPAGAPTPAAPAAPANAAFRARWLGVYEQLTGDPIEGVRVLDMATGNSALTSKDGAVNLLYLSEGANLVKLQKVGFEPITVAVAIGPRDTMPMTMLMRRLTELPAVVTTSKSESSHLSGFLRGFDERRRNAASGYFITDSVIRREEYRTLADLLHAHAPNVVIQHDGRLGDQLAGSPSCTWREGPPQVYVDGVAVAPPVSFTSKKGNAPLPPFDLSQFNLIEIGAIEWYPDNARTPVEFTHTSARCGALLLWTRER